MDGAVVRMVELARECLKSSGYFVDQLWHVDDVHFICEQNELPRLSNDEAMEIFAVAHEQFDGETGVSWPQLEKAVKTYMHRKAVLGEPCETASLTPASI